MSEIKVEDYVRTNKGNIGKVIDIFVGHTIANYHIEFQTGVKVKRQYLSNKTIIKYSPKIIDLIEERRLCERKINPLCIRKSKKRRNYDFLW